MFASDYPPRVIDARHHLSLHNEKTRDELYIREMILGKDNIYFMLLVQCKICLIFLRSESWKRFIISGIINKDVNHNYYHYIAIGQEQRQWPQLR